MKRTRIAGAQQEGLSLFFGIPEIHSDYAGLERETLWGGLPRLESFAESDPMTERIRSGVALEAGEAALLRETGLDGFPGGLKAARAPVWSPEGKAFASIDTAVEFATDRLMGSGAGKVAKNIYGFQVPSRADWVDEPCRLVSSSMSSETSSTDLTPGYGALRESAAWRVLPGRGKIRMLGEDRKRLLHAMTTNHIEQLEPGQGCYAFFLNAQGRVIADINVLAREDELLLDTEPETAKIVFDHLDRYIIADDVTLEDATESLVTVAIEGPESESVLQQLGAPIPTDSYASIEWKNDAGTDGPVEGFITRLDPTGAGGFLIIVRAEQRQNIIAKLGKLGVQEASAADARVVRLENRKPRYSEEITDKYLVQEIGQMHAIHFSKGCYLGQEIVERVRSRGQVHRHLRGLLIDTVRPTPAGTKLTRDGADVGEIVSSAYSPALEKTAAMGYVRTPADETGTELDVAGVTATVR